MAASLDRISWATADVAVTAPGASDGQSLSGVRLIVGRSRRAGRWQGRILDRQNGTLLRLMPEVRLSLEDKNRALIEGADGERWVAEKAGGCSSCG